VLAVIGDQFVERHVQERDQTGAGSSSAAATIPDVAVREDPEPRLAIVLLLGDAAVEPHVPLAEGLIPACQIWRPYLRPRHPGRTM
jgi:hypothetical protein